MIVYSCTHCRQELYREDEEEKLCEDHPGAPVERINVPDNEEE